MRWGHEQATLPHNAVTQDGTSVTRCSPVLASRMGLKNGLLFLFRWNVKTKLCIWLCPSYRQKTGGYRVPIMRQLTCNKLAFVKSVYKDYFYGSKLLLRANARWITCGDCWGLLRRQKLTVRVDEFDDHGNVSKCRAGKPSLQINRLCHR